MAKANNEIIKKRIAGSWVSTVISISLLLLLVGVGALLVVNARSVSNYFKEHMQVSVLLKDDVSDEAAADFEKVVAGVTGVKSTRLVTREEGIEEMAQMLGRDFLSVFQEAPVPVSIDITLYSEFVSANSIAMVEQELMAFPEVDEVVYQTSLVDALNQNLGKISAALGVLIALLLFISVVLMAGTVRLTVFSRRFTIHTMQLVGATRSFIRRPFVWQAALQGLVAALLAIGMLVGLLFALRSSFSQLFGIFTLQGLVIVMATVLVTGLLICTLSTTIVVNRLVGFNRDQLYSY
ncbi:MAG: permease-like cell division protein FtsX [Bacteroidales bacterium]|nr:permease-like cell division protein FtsX [Bacteroidales bacterium]